MALSQKVCKHYQLQNKYPGTKAEISVLASFYQLLHGLSTQTHPIHRGNRHAAKTKKQMTTPLPTGHSASPHNMARHPWSLLWLHLFHVMLLSKRLKLQESWKFKWNNATYKMCFAIFWPSDQLLQCFISHNSTEKNPSFWLRLQDHWISNIFSFYVSLQHVLARSMVHSCYHIEPINSSQKSVNITIVPPPAVC